MTNLRRLIRNVLRLTPEKKKKKRPFKAIRKERRTKGKRISSSVLAKKILDPWQCLPLRSPSPASSPEPFPKPSRARRWPAEINELLIKAMKEKALNPPRKVEPCGSRTEKDADGNILWEITWISDTPSPTPSPPPSPPDVSWEEMFPNNRVILEVDGFPPEILR